jgi:hypothetical protein
MLGIDHINATLFALSADCFPCHPSSPAPVLACPEKIPNLRLNFLHSFQRTTLDSKEINCSRDKHPITNHSTPSAIHPCGGPVLQLIFHSFNEEVIHLFRS